MQIFIEIFNIKRIILEVEPSDTIKKIINNIKEMEKDIIYRLRYNNKQSYGLFYNDKVLESSRTLSDYGIQNHFVLYLIPIVDILYQVPNGENVHLEFALNETLANLKAKIKEKYNISLDQYAFTYRGKRIKDNELFGNFISDFFILCLNSGSYGCHHDIIYMFPVINFLIKSLSNKIIPIEANPSSKIEHIKNIIEEKEGISITRQNLYFNNKILDDENTLSYYNIQNDSVIQLDVIMNNDLLIYVKTPKSDNKPLNIKSLDTIESIKFKIENEMGYSFNHQQLFFKDKKLDNDNTVSFYNIKNEDTLNLSLLDDNEKVLLIKLSNNKSICVKVKSCDIIKIIKYKIQDKESIPIHRQTLVFNDNYLKDYNTIAYYNIQNNSELSLFIKYPKYKIFINTITGLYFPLKVKSTNSIQQIKEMIYDESRIPFDQQRLIFSGKQLEDQNTLSFYNIENGSTLHLVLRLRG